MDYILFGGCRAYILYSAFSPLHQFAAMIMAGVSMVGFAMLVLGTGGYNEAIGKVLFIDILGILFLIAAAVLKYAVKTG